MIVYCTQTEDRAGKKRKGISDALGRMVRVIEDPLGQDLSTGYTFDTLGNLRKTTQGEQSRYFMHDSLGRLLYAKQVEQDANVNFSGSNFTDSITGNNQWSVKYVYDDNSNIISTTDAKNTSVTAVYDNLNRIKTRDYSDTTPDVSFYYDGKGLPSEPQFAKGQTTKVTSSVSEARYTGFDNLSRVTAHQQITDGQTYSTGYVYNLSGALIEETYPSGRVVKNTLDADGQLSQVQSKKNSNYGYFAYAKGFAYDSAGNVTKMQLGNGRWETASFNNRQQVTQIGLGVTDNTQNLLKLELSYGTSTQNNGSLREQKITVPTVGSTQGFTAIQTYAYDDLNRLSSATETISGSHTWKQTFSYDRYGNRRFDAANTTTLGSCTQAICNPTISTSNNRISQAGYGFDTNGSVTIDGEGKQFFYDAENHQKEVKDSANNSLGQYLYDGDGHRVKKITNSETTIFVYDATSKLVAEYSTAVAPTQQVSYLTTDHLGSPRVITNENGAVTSRKDFTAFGEENVTAQRSAGLGYQTPNIRKDYTGYEKDSESGLEFAEARYYNPIHGRFTSVDPLTASANVKDPQTLNRYSYALNSPYKFTDPLGLVSGVRQGSSAGFDVNNKDLLNPIGFDLNSAKGSDFL
ncbi:MAG: RHS repeat domain-containing protein [Pyrinomonadaceae bacterium]